MPKSITLVAAVARSGVIGKDGTIPWDIPTDLKQFYAVTVGRSVIMGTATYKSIGRPLRNRQNIVMTRNPELTVAGCTIATSPEQAIELAETAEICVIGGSSIYQIFMPLAQTMLLSLVRADVEGDRYFPTFCTADWSLAQWQQFDPSPRDSHDFLFTRWERRVSGGP